MSNLLKSDDEYKNWIADISKRFKASQFKAAVKVNSEMLQFYWSVGRDIANLSEKNGYGSDFYNTVSKDLKEIFPDVKSFSPTNLKYMRYFYEMYPYERNRQQLVDDFGMEVIFGIPWGHHVQILGKCKGNPEKALFYVRKTLENNWSRSVLLNFLDTDLYERQGKAVTNFKATLPQEQSDLAQ